MISSGQNTGTRSMDRIKKEDFIMMKKKLLATLLTLSMTATTLAGATVVSAAEEHEPVELTIWVTSRNQDDWYLSMEEKFLEEHPWITLNKVVKEGDPGNEFYQGVAPELLLIW